MTLCFNVDEVNKDELAQIPDGIKEDEIPMLRKVVPGKNIGLAERLLADSTAVRADRLLTFQVQEQLEL